MPARRASSTTPAWQVAVEATGSISTILFIADRDSTTSSNTGTLPPAWRGAFALCCGGSEVVVGREAMAAAGRGCA